MNIYRMTILFFCFSASVFAKNDATLHFSKPITVNLPASQGRQEKLIALQHYSLTTQQREALADRVRKKSTQQSFSLTPLSINQKQLGMNDVPVRDQGPYGTCVTFANVAAIDALLFPEQYISALCHLTLGQYLENYSKYYESGWDGSIGESVLNQMYYYGVIPASQENVIRCGDTDNYFYAGLTRSFMSLPEYNQHSQPLENIGWAPILSYADGFYLKTQKMNEILNQVRDSLRVGDRMTLGFLIDSQQFFVGAVGKYHVWGDSWVMTPEVEKNLSEGLIDTGHEVVMTGFDDDALIYDTDDHAHRGVFTLRNSWGPWAGDQGNYYMSYDYFLLMAVEVQRIFKRES